MSTELMNETMTQLEIRLEDLKRTGQHSAETFQEIFRAMLARRERGGSDVGREAQRWRVGFNQVALFVGMEKLIGKPAAWCMWNRPPSDEDIAFFNAEIIDRVLLEIAGHPEMLRLPSDGDAALRTLEKILVSPARLQERDRQRANRPEEFVAAEQLIPISPKASLGIASIDGVRAIWVVWKDGASADDVRAVRRSFLGAPPASLIKLGFGKPA